MGNVLIHANKPVSKKLGRPTKRASTENIDTGKSKQDIIPTSFNEIRYDQMGNWPETVDKKIGVAYVKLILEQGLQSVTFLYVR